MKFDIDQLKIIDHQDGHALVLAGAGSGKTACVTNRVATRIIAGLEPSRMLLLTFTNKACSEMRERLAQILECHNTAMPTISTFHAFGHRLVRKYPLEHNRKANPSLMGVDEPELMLKKIFMSAGIPKHSYPDAFAAFNKVRNDGLNPHLDSEAKQIMQLFEHTNSFTYGECDRLTDCVRKYEELKQSMNLMDFDDLLNLPIHALQAHPELRGRINAYLKDITVDEAQDNNKAQYKLLCLLAGETVVMVGDDDQSIHRWRGAHPDGLEQFKKEFRPAVYLLERNYRSLASIVDSATRLIRNNSDRLEKNPYPTRQQESTPIPFVMHRHSDVMAEQITQDIDRRIKHGTHPSQIAILYRTNAMSKVLEGAMLRRGIPYRVKKGHDIMSYAEIKMLMAAARLAVNPHDQMAFERLCVLTSGLGPKTVDKIAQASNEAGIFAGIDAAADRHKEHLQTMETSLKSLYRQGPRKLLSWAVGPGGFKKWLRKEAERAVKTKKKSLCGENLKQAINEGLRNRANRLKIIQDTIDLRLNELEDTVEHDELWAHALDMLIQPPDEDLESGSVTLSTVHGAKGLQWDTVHVAGFSEGLMPFEKDGVVQNMTEERCLAYVAMTRAENNLFLHHSQELDMKMGQGIKHLSQSRFVGELEQDRAPSMYTSPLP